MIRDGDETLRGVMALPGGVSPEPPLAAPGARPTTRVLDDGDDESIAGELGTVRGAPNIPPSATKLGWLDGSGPIASPARVKPKRILVNAAPMSPPSRARASATSRNELVESGRACETSESGEDNGETSEKACMQTLGALLFNCSPQTGLTFWEQHELCVVDDPVSVGEILIATEGLSLFRLTEYLTEPSTPAQYCETFAEMLVGSQPGDIVDALRRYFSKLQMPADGVRWRRLATAFSAAFIAANPGAISSVEQCERVVTAILAVNEGLHSHDVASPGGRRRPMESRAGFTHELRGSMKPTALAAAFDGIAAEALVPGSDHTEDCSTALAMLTRVDPAEYEDPSRFYVAYHEVVLVEDAAKITPSGKRRRCLMIFNDAIFFCKARPTGYEVRAILPTEVVYARTPSIDLYPTAIVLADSVTHEPQLTVSAKPHERDFIVSTINRLHTQQQFVVTPNAETLDTLVGSLADDIGGGTLALTIRRLNRLSDEVVEAAILGTNGVLSAHVDLVSASILIKYNPEQTGPHRIRRYLNTLGVVTSRTSCEGRRVHITRAAPKHDKDEDSDEFSEVVRDEPAKHECAESDDSDAYIDRRGIVDENDSDEFTEVLSGGSAVVKSVEDALDLDTKIQNLEVELKKLLSEKKETARRKAYNTLLQIRQRNAESRSVPLRITPQAIPQYHLHSVVSDGDVSATSTLLAMSLCDPNEPDEEGRTPLMHAAAGNADGCAQVLLSNGVDPNVAGPHGATALHEAAHRGDRGVMRTLVAAGANLMVADDGGRLPIHWAVSDPSHIGSLSYILDTTGSQYVNVPARDGMTPVMIAAFHNRADCVQMLLEHRADLDEKDSEGKTAAHWAVHPNGTACFELLLSIQTTFYKDYAGTTVAHRVGETGNVESANLLLNLRPDCVQDIDKEGRTPLIWAAACNNPGVLRCYLEVTDTNVHHRASSGKDALQYAITMGRTECERILREWLKK